MKQAGLIQGEVAGVSVCYCLNPAVFQYFKAIFAALRQCVIVFWRLMTGGLALRVAAR